jgi:hypothetical protein
MSLRNAFLAVTYSPYFFEVPYFERLGILSAIRTAE